MLKVITITEDTLLVLILNRLPHQGRIPSRADPRLHKEGTMSCACLQKHCALDPLFEIRDPPLVRYFTLGVISNQDSARFVDMGVRLDWEYSY